MKRRATEVLYVTAIAVLWVTAVFVTVHAVTPLVASAHQSMRQ